MIGALDRPLPSRRSAQSVPGTLAAQTRARTGARRREPDPEEEDLSTEWPTPLDPGIALAARRAAFPDVFGSRSG
jgi:hypothetical protein